MSRLTCENCKRWNTVDCPESYREPAGCDDICDSFELEVDACLLDEMRREIEAKSFTQEIFDEDVFRSAYTENVTKEEAEEESIIETEVVKLSDVLEIISKYSGKNAEADDKVDCATTSCPADETVSLVINLPINTYDYWKEHAAEYVLAEAVKNGVLLEDVRRTVSKAWYTKPKNAYERGLKDQALKDMRILDDVWKKGGNE